jgi:hypothetical protein
MSPVRKLLAALLLLVSLSACQLLFPFSEPDGSSPSSEPIVTPAADETTPEATPLPTLPPPASENPIISPSIEVPPPIY